MTTPERIGLPEPAMNALRQYPNYWFNVDANGIVTAHTTPPLQGEGMGEVDSVIENLCSDQLCVWDTIRNLKDGEGDTDNNLLLLAMHCEEVMNALKAGATHPPASANPVTPSAESVAREIVDGWTGYMAEDKPGLTYEQHVSTIAALIQAHTDMVVAETMANDKDLHLAYMAGESGKAALQARNVVLEEALQLARKHLNAPCSCFAKNGEEYSRMGIEFIKTVLRPVDQALANKEANHE